MVVSRLCLLLQNRMQTGKHTGPPYCLFDDKKRISWDISSKRQSMAFVGLLQPSESTLSKVTFSCRNPNCLSSQSGNYFEGIQQLPAFAENHNFSRIFHHFSKFFRDFGPPNACCGHCSLRWSSRGSGGGGPPAAAAAALVARGTAGGAELLDENPPIWRIPLRILDGQDSRSPFFNWRVQLPPTARPSRRTPSPCWPRQVLRGPEPWGLGKRPQNTVHCTYTGWYI